MVKRPGLRCSLLTPWFYGFKDHEKCTPLLPLVKAHQVGFKMTARMKREKKKSGFALLEVPGSRKDQRGFLSPLIGYLLSPSPVHSLGEIFYIF